MDVVVMEVAEDGEVSVKSLANRAVAMFPFEYVSFAFASLPKYRS